MKSFSLTVTGEELKKLQQLINELDSYYNYNNTKVWSFEDVDVQREIAIDMANILRNKF